MDIVRLAAKTIKNHKPLWPLAGLTILAFSMAGTSISKHAFYHPEVTINRKAATKPWERIKPGTIVKFYDPMNRKSGNLKDEGNNRPDYRS